MSIQRVISIGYGRHFFQSDNAERARMELCAQETVSYDMVIFTVQSDGLQTETSGALTLHPTNSRNRLLMLVDAFLITRKLCRQTQIDVLTTQDPFAAGLVGVCISFVTRVHLVVQEHGDFFSTGYWRRESVINRIWYVIGLGVLRRADVVRVVSARIQHTINQVLPAKPVTVLPVSIHPEPFLNPTRTHAQTDTFTYLSVARFVPQKNIHNLLHAFTAAHQSQPHMRLQLVGTGPLRSYITNYIAYTFPHNSPITLADWTDDVPQLMRTSDAYVLSSNYEGWARVLIEALLNRLPIVTTDVGCVGEVVLDGEHGVVVPVDDTAALTTALLQLVTDGALQQHIYQTLQTLDPTDLPGVDADNYGQQWLAAFAR